MKEGDSTVLRKLLTCLLLCLLATPQFSQTAPSGRADTAPPTVDFRDIAPEAGLTAENVSGDADNKRYILETTGDGVAIFDLDNDGLMDVFLVNGTTLDGKGPGEKSTSHLYRNLGNLHFEDITQKAGLGKIGWGQGVCAGDYDNDGYEDLFVTYYGHSVLYHNEGDGTFRDVTEEAGLNSDAVRWDTGCTFVDYDLDGKLDLAVTGYVEFDRTRFRSRGQTAIVSGKACRCSAARGACPQDEAFCFTTTAWKIQRRFDAQRNRQADRLLRLHRHASDFDNDGYPDLYISCDSRPSLLYHNRKNGTFEETGIISGMALNDDGQEQAGMGVTASDYDEDGFVDIAKTNFSEDMPNLYHNNGDGTLLDGCMSPDWERATNFWAGAFNSSTSITMAAKIF